jgi:hypothetical protein
VNDWLCPECGLDCNPIKGTKCFCIEEWEYLGHFSFEKEIEEEMKLRLSETAYGQLYGEKKKEAKNEKEEAKKAKKEEQRKKAEARQERKRQKIEARETAVAAENKLKETYGSILNFQRKIETFQRRMENDKNDHRIRVERAANHVKNLKKRLANLKQEISEAEAELEAIESDVPKSVANIDETKKARKAKIEELKVIFEECKNAWDNPQVSKSARNKKLNKKLHKQVKLLLSE